MKTAKKTISVILCAILAFALAVPAFAGLSGGYTAPIPTVYLRGQGANLYVDKDDTSSEQIQDIEVPDGYIGDAAKTMIVPLMRGLTRNDWDEWCDLLVDAVATLYEKQALDENGEASNGSGVYTSSGKANRKNADGAYDLGAYTPLYDWRLDPCAIADDIHNYIQEIKAATKCDKVNLVGRSIGSSVVMAYLAKYGADDLENTVLYCPSFYGMEVFSDAFAGKAHFDGNATNRFANYYIATGELDDVLDGSVLNVLADIVTATASGGAMELTSGVLNRIYEQVYEKVYPRLLVKMYGSMPSFWSLVGDDDFEDAKKLIFGGQEDTYAKLIQKIDDFHYNILNQSANIINGLISDGAKVHIVAKYGVPFVPMVENPNELSDMLTSVYSASLGATCSEVEETLPTDYIMAQSRRGLYKYISKDKQIDASTGILPDHTWYIKNLAHRTMPDGVNILFERIFNYDGYMTVFDDPEMTQYLCYDASEDTVHPLSADDPDNTVVPKVSFFQRIRSFFRAFFTLIRSLFSRN